MFSTFVINLDKDTDRLAFMDGQLSKQNIKYRRQSGVYGKTCKPTLREYDEAKAIKKGGRALLPGEVGCALSHVAVLKKIVNDGMQYALVLEDDVLLPENFKEILEKEILRQTAYKWDYLLFDYVQVGYPFLKQWLGGVQVTFLKTLLSNPLKALLGLGYALIKSFYIIPLCLFEGVRDWYRAYNPGPVAFYRPIYFAGAYLVTRSGAERLLSLTHPIVYTADQLPNRARVLCGLRLRGYAPCVVKQLKTTFGSSILDLSGQEL